MAHGKPGATEEEIVKATKAANAHEVSPASWQPRFPSLLKRSVLSRSSAWTRVLCISPGLRPDRADATRGRRSQETLTQWWN